MAKSSKPPGGTSHIRFVMVEAEIANGDITSITQAITNALRGPTPTIVKRIAAPAIQVNGAAEPADEPEVTEDASEGLDAVDVTPAAPKRKAQRRVAAKPQPIEIDVDSNPPLSSLGTFKSNNKRYLAIAAWLHDHRNIEIIDERHIYSC
jgi:hypothetical protein